MVSNMICFYGEEWLVPLSTSMLEDHPISAINLSLNNPILISCIFLSKHSKELCVEVVKPTFLLHRFSVVHIVL